MKKSLLTPVTLMLALAGCALPTSQVNSGAVRPSLTVLGAPANAKLYLDGVLVGDAALYGGSGKKLWVEEGVHQVLLKQDERIIYALKILASNGETSTITYQAEEK